MAKIDDAPVHEVRPTTQEMRRGSRQTPRDSNPEIKG
jgi:hypothetical protein